MRNLGKGAPIRLYERIKTDQKRRILFQLLFLKNKIHYFATALEDLEPNGNSRRIFLFEYIYLKLNDFRMMRTSVLFFVCLSGGSVPAIRESVLKTWTE